MPEKFMGEVRVMDEKGHSTLEILVPKGLTHKELSRVNLGDLLAKFRPSGCGTCLSGQDFHIRERFEKVLPVDITSMEKLATH